jgi:dephospho-CoA kinase
MMRDRVAEAEVLQRMQHQLPDQIKKERADYVIYNDEKQPLIPQIEKTMAELSGK